MRYYKHRYMQTVCAQFTGYMKKDSLGRIQEEVIWYTYPSKMKLCSDLIPLQSIVDGTWAKWEVV